MLKIGFERHNRFVCSLNKALDDNLFPKMMKELSGSHFDRDDDDIAAEDDFLEVQDADKEVIHTLHASWTKCANVGGDYIEK